MLCISGRFSQSWTDVLMSRKDSDQCLHDTWVVLHRHFQSFTCSWSCTIPCTPVHSPSHAFLVEGLPTSERLGLKKLRFHTKQNNYLVYSYRSLVYQSHRIKVIITKSAGARFSIERKFCFVAYFRENVQYTNRFVVLCKTLLFEFPEYSATLCQNFASYVTNLVISRSFY